MWKELFLLTCLVMMMTKIQESEAAPQTELSLQESKGKEGSGGSGGGKESKEGKLSNSNPSLILLTMYL